MAIFGISAHKTTIYHSQQIGLLNGGWLPDPVQTAAMQGAVTSNNPAISVMDAVSNGQGQGLKQYYPYATRRFKKRNVAWNILVKHSSSEFEIGLNKDRLLSIIPELRDKEFRVIHDVDYFSVAGAKTFEDMEKLFGWNDFTKPLADGTNIVITGAESASVMLDSDIELVNCWVVGIETSKNLPVVILDPNIDESKIKTPHYTLAVTNYTPELSGGLVYWESSKGFQSQSKTKPVEAYYKVDEFKTLQKRYNISDDPNADPVIVERISDWKYDAINDVTTNTDPIPDDGSYDKPEETPIIEPMENVSITYMKVSKVQHDLANQDEIIGYRVISWIETGIIEYDSEHYVWATATAESHVGVKEYFTNKSLLSANQIGSSKSQTWFKFYPYLPVKEYEQMVLDFSKAPEYLKALKNVSGSSENETESDAPKTNRLGTRAEQSKHKKSTVSTKSTRIVSNKKRYTRRIKVRGNLGLTEHDERHLEKMGELLSSDYKEIASTLEINQDIDKIYHASIMPAVSLGSNFDEVNNYWYEFFKRLYSKIGQSTFLNFTDAVDKLDDNCLYTDILKLPRVELNYGIPNGQFGGFISFAYMRHFRMKGSIRKTARKHSLKEVKLGKLAKLHKLNYGVSLKTLLKNPSKEMVENTYHTSPVSGKQYNIGGGELFIDIDPYMNPNIVVMPPAPPKPNVPSPFSSIKRENAAYSNHAIPIKSDNDIAELMFSNFGYTFFCKDVGNGELDVFAVAGLVGGQTRTGYVTHDHGSTALNGQTVAARACQDLAMFWTRNKQKYIDKVAKEKIDVKAVFTSGSSRKKLETNIQSFFVIPLDYKTVTRLSGTDIMRLADRAVLTVTWTKIRVRRLRGWVKVVLQIIGIIVTIVGIYYGDGGSTGMTILAMVKALAIAVAVQLVVKYGISLLIRVFGIRGILAIILAIIVMVVVAMAGGFGSSTSSLPYASQTAAAQVASTATQASISTIQNSILENLKQMIQEMLKKTMADIANMGTKELLENAATAITKLADGATTALAEQQKDIAKQLQESTEEYQRHIQELEELQELNQERTAPYDIKEVMAALMNKTKLIDPDNYLMAALNADNALASEEYISQFINSRLSIEPSTFDSIKSLDFSLKYE